MDSRSTINDRFRRFQAIVKTVVRKYVFNQDDADEVTQDALVRLFKAHNRLPADPKQLKNYISKTARNAAADHLRVIYRERQYRDEYHYVDTVSSTVRGADEDDCRYIPERDHAFESDLDLDMQTKKVIQLLPAQQREALLMLADGYSYHDISSAQNVSVGTVRSRIFYARKRAGEILNEETA